METENRIVVTRAGEGEGQGRIGNGYRDAVR
jgi:hypothetical protein